MILIQSVIHIIISYEEIDDGLINDKIDYLLKHALDEIMTKSGGSCGKRVENVGVDLAIMSYLLLKQ